MIKVHHLNNSRSHRILWLLEELNIEYEIIKYKRDTVTNLAPKDLKDIHILGKSPVIIHNEKTIIESGAIVTYIIDQFANEGFSPKVSDEDYYEYLELIHYAEGSAITPFLLLLYTRVLGENSKPLQPRIQSEIKNHLGFLSNCLGDSDFFFRNKLSGVDIMLSFVLEGAQMSRSLEPFPNLQKILKRYQERNAYKKAIELGGKYLLGK